MAFACKQASFLDDIDVPAELNDEVFIMQGVFRKKAEQERLLGSRLEDELNRSIEKLRELERRAVCDTMRLAQLLSGDDNPDSSLGTEEELLEDIEKPVLNSSESSSAELVSISTGSPSPVKHYSSFWEGIQNSSLYGPVKKATSGDSNSHSSVSSELPILMTNKEDLMDDRETPALHSSGPDCAELVSFPTGSPSPVRQCSRLRNRMNGTITINQSEKFGSDDSNFQVPVTPTDVAQKIMQLSYPVPPKLARLVSVNEIGLQASERAAGSGSSGGQERSLEKISPKEKSANMTSSPVSSSELPSLSILNLDEVSDSLLSSSLMSSPSKKPTDGEPAVCAENSRDESGVDIEERIKKLCEGLKLSGGESTHNPEAAGTSPPLSPSSRMTFGGACTTLNMEELNDSLLLSLCIAKSPIPEEESNFLVPTPVAEFKKKLLREQGEGKKSASGYFISKLGTEGLERLLNETQCIANKSMPLSDSPKDLDNVLSTDKIIGALERLTEGPDSTFVQTSAKPLNNTFNTGGNTDEASKEEAVTIQAPNTTFCQVKVQNETFCTQSNEPANITFDSKPAKVADTTFGIEGKGKNETFEKISEMNPVTDSVEENEKNCEKLNVTFEKGEYHIASLNETISLMDAEGDVLQLILDSTPGKPSKIKSGAVSTPKAGNVQEVPAKNTVTKDPAQSFIHRMSLGVRRNAQNATDNKQQDSVISQPPNLCAALPGLKGGCVSEQSVTNKLRRFQGGQGRSKNGPVRALPLACMSVDSSDDKAQKNTPDGLDGIKALENINNTPEEGDNKDLSKGVRRPQLPSFGSCSSIENERPSTPDLVLSRGILTSTPDISRPTCGSMHPRITSTPATKIGPFSDALGIEGPAPTPIAAPASRSRFIVSTTSSVPEQHSQDNPSLENLKGSSKSDVETVNTPAKKSSVVSAAPVTCTQDGRALHSTADVYEGNPPKYENNEDHETAQIGVENIDSDNARASLDVDKVTDCPGALEGEYIPVEDMNENLNASLVLQSHGEDNKNQVNSEGKHLSHHKEATSPQVTSIARESEEMPRYEERKNGEASYELDPESCSENVYLKQSEKKEYVVKDINQSFGKQEQPSEVEEGKDSKKSEIAELQPPQKKIGKGQENDSDIGHNVNSDLVTKPSESLQPQPKEIEPSPELPQNKNHECSSSTSNKSVRKDESDDSCKSGPPVISEKVNETKIIDQPDGNKLNQASVLNKDENRGKGLMKKSGPVSKVNTGVRRSTVEKFNIPTTENKASSLKKKINVNKENIQVSQPKGNLSTTPKVLTANKNQKLRAKLPSQRISLAPSNGQTKLSVESAKKRHASAGSAALRTKTVADKEAEITPNKPLARPSLVRQTAKAIPVKPTGIRPPNMKGKSEIPDSAGSKPASRMQPPSRSLLQPQGTSKLALEPRSYSGNPVKGVVRTPGNSASKLLSKLPSKLPATTSSIPAHSARTAGGSVSSSNSGGFSRTLKRPGHEVK